MSPRSALLICSAVGLALVGGLSRTATAGQASSGGVPEEATLPRLPAPGLSPPPSPIPLGVSASLHMLAPPSGSPAEKLHWLGGEIDHALADPHLAGATSAVLVVDVGGGKPLYARNDNAPFNIASNVKLFTTAAALALLGPEYRWKTTVYADGPIVGGELKGRLYLQGRGDPTLVIEDLWRLVTNLSELGVRKVSGDVAVDDAFFDTVRIGPAFDQKQEDGAFRAPQGALSLNYNAVAVRVLPGSTDGAPARVIIDPMTPYFVVSNEARTVLKGRTALTVEAKPSDDHTQITVAGRVAQSVGNGGEVDLRRVTHPDLYAGWAFRELCLRHGIKVTGGLVRATVPGAARALVSHYSQPLGIVIRDVNKRSNNFMAEQILKTLGGETGGVPGTWPKGIDAVAGFLEKLGTPRTAYRMTNGSGLYDSNRFTAAQLVMLLGAAYRDFRYAADFVGSLAMAGADGTVGHRMEGGPAERWVRAKTGTLLGVSCLSGYAGAPGRAPVAFAVLINGLPNNDDANAYAHRAQDRIASALAAYQAAR